jgi:hypothetical protein
MENPEFEISEEIKKRFEAAAAQMIVKYNISHDDITEFMMDIIFIFADYVQGNHEK